MNSFSQNIPERVHDVGVTSETHISVDIVGFSGGGGLVNIFFSTGWGMPDLKTVEVAESVLIHSSHFLLFSCQFTQDWTHPLPSFHILELLLSTANPSHLIYFSKKRQHNLSLTWKLFSELFFLINWIEKNMKPTYAQRLTICYYFSPRKQ